MKTIEILSGGQKVQFTTKSATFDNKEFLYAHMTQVVNDAENYTYTFTYEGETKTLPYLPKDAKVLNAIFSQVQKMEALKKKQEAPTEEKPPVDKEITEEAEVKETPVSTEKVVEDEKSSANEDVSKADEAEETAESTETTTTEETAEAGETEEAASTEEKLAKKKVKEKTPVDPEKQARHKKSLKIFAIVLGIVLVVSVAYYFIFGTNNTSIGNSPGNTDVQQYDDIDQLIEDLQ